MLMQPKDDGFEGGIAMFPAWPCDWDVDVKLARQPLAAHALGVT